MVRGTRDNVIDTISGRKGKKLQENQQYLYRPVTGPECTRKLILEIS